MTTNARRGAMQRPTARWTGPLLGALFSASALAVQSAAQEALPVVPPEVASVTVVGYWADGSRGGDIRVILYEKGLEDTSYQTVVDWIERNFDERTIGNAAVAELKDCSGGNLAYSEIDHFRQSGIRRPTILRLRLGGESEGAAPSLTFRIGKPGEVELASGC